MKKVMALLIAVIFIASAMPALGQTAETGAKEDSVFQIISDTIDKPIEIAEKDKVKPIKKVTIFQICADGIKEGSEKARDLSARGE